MLKPFLPTLVFLFFFSAANAQNSAATFYKAGINYKLENKMPEAMAAFNKAVSVNKRFDSAYVALADLYFRSGNMDMSISHYQKALAINPIYTNALVGIGMIYRDTKKIYDSALFYYHAAAKVDSSNKEVFYALAWTYNAKKEFEKAIPFGIKALEIDNNYKAAYGELGYAYRSTKKFAECIEQLKKNLAVSVMDVALLYTAYCYIELKDKDAALQKYEDLKKVNDRMATSLKKKIDAMQ